MLGVMDIFHCVINLWLNTATPPRILIILFSSLTLLQLPQYMSNTP